MVGDVGIGGGNPVRVQSMTNTPTLDTQATVDQIIRIADAGAEIVRMTVRSIKEAGNLAVIREALHVKGCFIPLVADVHFNPAIAETAAAIVEKVRINPGNYGIAGGPACASFSEEDYSRELEKARAAFSRLVAICREHGTALRIGVNHGSLSPRIINRYGNTPEGMAHSAMEFLKFCAEEEFHNVVVSLKSSNILIMIKANRLIAEYMEKEGMDYPLHLGVTEAGEGEDGRIRSVAGIGTLLAVGIGDTIRISLTEDPEKEIPVARKLLKYLEGRGGASDPQPRISRPVRNIGGEQVPVVIMTLRTGSRKPLAGFTEGGTVRSENDTPGGVRHSPDHHAGKRNSGGQEPDYLFMPESSTAESYPVAAASDYMKGLAPKAPMVFVEFSGPEDFSLLPNKIASDPGAVIVAASCTTDPVSEIAALAVRLEKHSCSNPLVLKKRYDTADAELFQVQAAADFAPLLADRVIDGIWIENEQAESSLVLSVAFSILQSTRARITKTDFISCPSCGRTMFDIQKATAGVKERLAHLRGLKIAVMGCIVNGPGEMADADYGYVGSGRGKVTLYKKQVPVKRNIPEERALDELIKLIRESGDWQ